MAESPRARPSSSEVDALQEKLLKERRNVLLLAQECDAAKSGASELKRRVQQLELDADGVRRDRARSDAQVTKLEDTLRETTQEAHKIVAMWKARCDTFEKDAECANERSERLELQLRTAVQREHETTATQLADGAKLQALQQRSSELEAQRNRAEERCSALAAQVDEAAKRNERLADHVSDLEASLADARAAAETNARTRAAQERDHATVHRDLEDARLSCARLQSDLNAGACLVDELKAELAQAAAEVAATKREGEVKAAHFQGELQARDVAVEAAKQERDAVAERLEAALSDLARVTDVAERRTADLAAQADLRDELHIVLKTAETDLAEAQKREAALRATVAEAASERERLMAECGATADKADAFAKLNDDLKADLDEERDTTRTERKRCEELHNMLHAANDATSAAETELVTEKAKRATLAREHDALQEAFNNLSEHLRGVEAKAERATSIAQVSAAEQLAAHTSTVDGLRRQLEEAEQQLAAVSARVLEAEQGAMAHKAALSDAEAAHVEAKAKLQQQLIDACDASEAATAAARKAEETATAATAAVADLEVRHTELTARAADLTQQLAEATTALDAATAKSAALGTEHDATATRLGEEQRLREEAERAHTESQALIEALSAQLEKEQQLRRGVEAALEALRQVLQETESSAAALSAKHASLAEEFDATVAERDQDTLAKVQRIAQLEGQLADVEAAHADEEQSLTERVAQLTGENADLDTELTSLREASNVLQTQLAEERTKCAELAAQLEAANATAARCARDHEAHLQAASDELHAAMTQASREAAEKTRCADRADAFEVKAHDLARQVASERSGRADAESEVSRLQRQLGSWQEERAKLRSRVSELTAQAASLTDDAAVTTDKLKDVEEALAVEHVKRQKLKEVVEEWNARYTRQREIINDLQNERDQARRDRDDVVVEANQKMNRQAEEIKELKSRSRHHSASSAAAEEDHVTAERQQQQRIAALEKHNTELSTTVRALLAAARRHESEFADRAEVIAKLQAAVNDGRRARTVGNIADTTLSVRPLNTEEGPRRQPKRRSSRPADLPPKDPASAHSDLATPTSKQHRAEAALPPRTA